MLEWVEAIRAGLLIGLAVAASVSDLARGKVYDTCTIPAMVLGLCLNIVLDGGNQATGFLGANQHLVGSVAGACVALALFGLFWRAGAVGGGDLKLAVAFGMIEGPKFLVWAVACGSLIGAIIALGAMIRRGRLREGIAASLRLSLRPWMWAAQVDETRAPLTVPYGLALSLGAIWVWAVSHGILVR